MTVRDQVSTILGTINMNFKTLEAHECADFALVLSSLLSSILEHEANAEGLCNVYKINLMEQTADLTDAKATSMMKSSPEWMEWQKVKALRIGVLETIRSLKSRVKLKTEEQQL